MKIEKCVNLPRAPYLTDVITHAVAEAVEGRRHAREEVVHALQVADLEVGVWNIHGSNLEIRQHSLNF